MRICTDDEITGNDKSAIRHNAVTDSGASDFEIVFHAILNSEFTHRLRKARRLNIFGRHKMIVDQRDLGAVKQSLCSNPFEDFDR